MGIKCILLYKLPKGAVPQKSDAERIIRVLTEQLCCIQVEGKGHSGGEKQIESVIMLFKQAQAQDLSIVAEPKSLADVWAFRLNRDVPNKLFLTLRGKDGQPRITEAEPSIKSFLERRMEYRQRAQIIIQSYSWSIGDRHSDVTVKLLQVSSQAQPPKVLAVELTYHPAVHLSTGEPVLRELADKLMSLIGPEVPGQPGHLVLLDPKYHRFQQGELSPDGRYSPLHTVVAYNELINEGLGAR